VGQDPSTIREEIEQTRAQMGDTVEAIGYKTDVKSRAADKVAGVRDRITGAKESVSDRTPSTGDVKDGAQKAVGVAQSNPLGLGIAALAGGFLVGMLLPTTNVENEKLGPMSDQLKEQAKETATEAVDRGKQVAQEAASAAADTAKEQGQEQAQELKDSAQQNAESVRS
jgi:gas vesicle protein